MGLLCVSQPMLSIHSRYRHGYVPLQGVALSLPLAAVLRDGGVVGLEPRTRGIVARGSACGRSYVSRGRNCNTIGSRTGVRVARSPRVQPSGGPRSVSPDQYRFSDKVYGSTSVGDFCCLLTWCHSHSSVCVLPPRHKPGLRSRLRLALRASAYFRTRWLLSRCVSARYRFTPPTPIGTPPPPRPQSRHYTSSCGSGVMLYVCQIAYLV